MGRACCHTVFQRHQSDDVNFTRNWADYKHGFGHVNGDFWWGNDKLARALNDGRQYELRIDMLDRLGYVHRYAKYSQFNVAPESDNYRLSISGYTGENTFGDSFGSSANGQQFSTFDRDNDAHLSLNCAAAFGGRGGFWWGGCGGFSPNGRVSPSGRLSPYTCLYWENPRGGNYVMKSVSMMYRAIN